jgi:transposase-like protein
MHFRKPEEIRRHLAVQPASGLSISSYCDKIGVHQNTFYYWRKRYSVHERSVVPVSFARIQVSAPVHTQEFEVVFDNRITLRVPPRFEAESLRMLIDTLR